LKKLGITVLVNYDDFETIHRKDERKNKIRGFWINVYDHGKYVSIRFTKKQEEKSLDPKSKESVIAQVEKINTRSKRMLELDDEKVHKRIIETMCETEELTVIGKHTYCEATERISRLILWNALGWPKKEQYGKLLDIDKYKKEDSAGFLKRLMELTKDDMAIIINNVGYDSFKSSLPAYREAMALRGLAESFGSIPIEDFEKEQKAIANKRISRQKERISKLKKSVK
jgi:hypothetical protein